MVGRETVELPGASPGAGRGPAIVSPRAARGQILANREPAPSTSRFGKYKGRQLTLRSCIYLTFDDPGFSGLAKVVAILMMLLILTVTTTYVLESEATLETGVLAKTDALSYFQDIEFYSVAIFTVEYIMRFLTCPILPKKGCLRSTVSFVMTPFNLIDAAACFPYWATYVMKQLDPDSDQAGLGFVRVIRLVRVFRVFRIGKYSVGIQMFVSAMTRSTRSMSILVLLLGIAVVLISSIMNMAEGNMDEGDQHQECFGTIPRCFWWAMVTMTTVGYGDCYPVSAQGKVLTSFTMLAGVLILALPITVVGSNFQTVVEMYEADAAVQFTAESFDADGDGKVDESELREFLREKRKMNELKRDGTSINPDALMAMFDEEEKGYLYIDEFKKLVEAVIDKDAQDPQKNIRTLLQHAEQTEQRVEELHKRMDATQDAVKRIEKLLTERLSKEPSGSSAMMMPIVPSSSAMLPPPSTDTVGGGHGDTAVSI